MKTKTILLFITLLFMGNVFVSSSQQTGDIVTVNGIKYKLLGENLINNPGFEDGFTGWTDATSSAEGLSSTNFTLFETGGIDDSKYIVGTKNESASSAGSIGTGWAIESGKTYYFSYHVKYQDAVTAAGTESWLKVSLTNNKTNSAEPLLLLDGAQVNGNGAWTKNEVGFTNSGTTYSYIVARFRWLNNRLGFDNFALYEAQEMPSTDSLQTVVNEAQALYNAGAVGASELQAAITTAQGFLTSTSASDVWKAIADLQEAILAYRLANASAENPVDMTHYIVNQGFDNNNADGWTGGGTVGYRSIEFYQKTFNLYQEISGLPAGKYTLKVQGFERPKSNDAGAAYKAGTETIYARFYAKSSSFAERNTPFNSIYKHSYSGSGAVSGYVNTMSGAEIMFTDPDNEYYETTVADILVGEGDVLIIGAKSDFQQTGYWALFDNFRLEYYGSDINDVVSYLNEQIAEGQALLSKKMQSSETSKLNDAITQAQQAVFATPVVPEDLYTANTRLLDAVKTALVSVKAYEDLQTAIDVAVGVYADGSGNAADVFQNAIQEAQALVNNLGASLDELADGTAKVNAAVFAFRLANATGTAPTVVTNPNYARGATAAFGRSTVTGTNITERGFCWSTHSEPTVLDNRTTKYFSNNGNIYHIQNLEPSTVYYMRAYAMTKDYAVGYGDVIKVITIPKGTVTYWLDGSLTGDNRTRVEEAVSSAVNYFNNLTSIQGHHLTVYYGSGTPTAEAGYGGYMRFGPSADYQRTGTALHEMGHTIGVGQHTYWTNTSSSPLKVSGIWLGERANKVVQFFDNNSTSTLKGDGVHMWPYGINGAGEDTGSEILYIANSLVHQAVGEDGLPPNSGGFTTPAYTFESENEVKYYIKNESEMRGRDDSFLIENESGQLVYQEMTGAEAIANEQAAWNLVFNPSTAYYQIRNAATGNYFTYKSSGINGIATVSKTTPAATENFQLMNARIDTQIGSGNITFTTKGYWIIRPEKNGNPPCLVANASGVTAAYAFNITNSASAQRWLILTGEEVELFEKAQTDILPEVDSSSVNIYTDNGEIYIENITSSADIAIYDISGKLHVSAGNVSGFYSQSLPKGMYIVSIRSSQNQDVRKVIVR